MKRNILIAAMAALAVAGCGKKSIDFDACGQIDAVKVTVAAESGGKLLSLCAEEGDRLEKGQLIGVIDSVQTYLQREELLRRKEGALVRIVDIPVQMKAMQEQLASHKTDLKRFRALVAGNAGTQKQVDDMEAQIAILQGQIDAQKINYENNNAGIRNEIGTYEVQIAKADDQLQKCRVTAPISGTVLTKYAEAGEMVTVGKPLYELADLDNVYVRAYVSTEQLAGVKLGDKVTVIPDDGTDSPKEYEGTLTWISSDAEFTPKNIQTRDERADLVYAVKVSVKNDGSLRLGMYAYVRL